MQFLRIVHLIYDGSVNFFAKKFTAAVRVMFAH